MDNELVAVFEDLLFPSFQDMLEKRSKDYNESAMRESLLCTIGWVRWGYRAEQYKSRR